MRKLTTAFAVILASVSLQARAQVFADVVDYANSNGSITTHRISVDNDKIQALSTWAAFKVKGLDADLVPLDGNCYCEYPNSDAFTYLNLLYFSNQYITYMNPFIQEIVGHPLPPITTEVTLDDTMSPAGYNAGTSTIRLWFGEANFDPGFVVHEISHQIHSTLIGKTQDDLYNEVGKDLDRKPYFEFLGVIEGVANFLTALYFEDPMIGKIAWVDIPYSMDSRVDYSAMPTEYDFNNRIAQSNLFAQRYPVLATRVRAALPTLPDANEPSPYLSSQIIFQPLWQYRTHYGHEDYIRFILKFLAGHGKFVSYVDFANQLIEYTRTQDKAFADFLTQEYTARGLAVEVSRN